MQSSLKPEEDYLDEDKPFKELVKRQNFCVISMLTPNSFPESRRAQYVDQKILGIKVRGVFETYEAAKGRCDALQKMDKYHNIFVGEVGKWLPFNVDIATMETEDDPVYREQALNQYMKAYKDSLKEEEVEEQERKDQTLKANNAKVVTGNHNAPEATGIGCPEITPAGIVPNSSQSTQSTQSTETSNEGPALESENEKVEVLRNSDKVSIDEQIKSTQSDKSKIETELEDSKNNLRELDAKLSAINQIYADLKK
jgi:flagellin-like hook-associated protein FlgL